MGLLVLAGWALETAILKTVAPGLPPMHANTALAFVLMGFAVVLLARPTKTTWVPVLRRLAALVALATGLLTLVEYAATINLAIDQLVVRDGSGVVPGRMAAVTALGLATSAAAFLLLDLGRAGTLAQTLALGTGVLGVLDVAAYVSGLESSDALMGYSSVAVHTTLALLVLSVGIILARPDRGLMRMALADTPAGVVLRRLLPVVIGAPLAVGWVAESGRHLAFYGPEFGMALFVVGTVVVLSRLVWSAASALQRADAQRRRAETLLQRADAEVGRVVARTVELTDTNKALVETTARLRTLGHLNRLVSSSLDFDAVLVAIARAAGDIMATPVVSFWVADEATRTVTVRAWSDAAAGADFPFNSFAYGQGMVGTVASNREPLHVPDVFAESRMLRARDWCQRHGLKSFFGVPVLAQDRLLAVLVLSAHAPLTLSHEDQELLASFVAQAAVAIENARLFAEAQARRRAAEAAEHRYRELFDRNLAGIIRATRDGRILDCNEAMVRMLGYGARTDVLALRAEDLYVHPAERERLLVPLRAGERLGNAEFRLRRADGTTIAVLVNMTATEGEDAEVVTEGIVVDITDRERAVAAEREAEALRAVTKLANGAAHEINNPLAVIMGDLDLMARRYAQDPEAMVRINRARGACRRIADMIGHMGRITRLEAFDQSPNLPPILDLRRSSAPEPPSEPGRR
jgi:PAS domain S-box-containing protein